MDLGLKDKVFVVTGGAKGIGAGICRSLHGEGAIPVIVGRSPEAGNELVKELKASGGDAHMIHKSLNAPENCESAINQTVEKYQRIDGLINNAGFNDGVGLENGTPDKFLSSLESNLHHYYFMAHFALPHLKKTRGSILNISSKTALTGQGATSAYAAAKAAQLGMTREWAVELLTHGIRVNAILPAEVWTALYERWLNNLPNSDETLENIVKNIPLGKRMTTTEEIGDLSAFILSDKSSHVTGQFIHPDGGYVHLDRALAGNQSD